MMQKTPILVALAVAAAAFAMPAGSSAGLPPEVSDDAYGEGAVDEGNARVETRLIVDKEQVTPGGAVRVGVHFAIDPDWHIYWRNSGDAGMSTRVRWGGEGLEYGALQWPAPRAHSESGGEVYTFGYSDEVVLFSESKVPQDASGPVRVTAKVDYLACKVDCIPGSAELNRSLAVGDAAEPGSEKQRNLLDEFAARVPQSADEAGVGIDVAYSQNPIRPGDTFRAAVGLDYCPRGPDSCAEHSVAGEVDAYRFIPDATAQIEWKTLGVRKHPTAKRGEVLILRGVANSNSPEDDERLSGVVWLKPNGDDGSVPIRVDASVPQGPTDAEIQKLEPALLEVGDLEGAGDAEDGDGPAAPGDEGAGPEDAERSAAAGGNRIGFWRALLFALLGGMILNLMPCVFPVLALKVTSFAELVHEDRSHAMLHGVAYTAGIVGSMLVLAAVVLGLRLAGTSVGWGFQFQNPVYPSILAAAVVLFAMNLFGIFEVRVHASKLAQTTEKASGLRRSAGEGVLAVVLATPCSAPFLGTAVGFALTGSAATVVATFAALGVGLAAPFVLLMLVPGWSEVLPDPGPWMVQIRAVLGFVLLGAAIWLLWIAGRTVGVDGMARAMIFLAVVAFAGWIYGAIQEFEWDLADVVGGAALGGIYWGAWVYAPKIGYGAAGRYAVAAALIAAAVVALLVTRPSAADFAEWVFGVVLVGSVAVGTWTLDFDRATAGPASNSEVASSADAGGGSGGAQTGASASSSGDEQGIEWRSWSDARVDGALEEGRPVFVDFTADWCITCKVNERTVLSTKRVRASFENHEVAAFKADWTDGDPRIQKKLKSFGQGGVPMYLVYSPDAPDDPELLPQVLTPGTVVEAVEEAASDG